MKINPAVLSIVVFSLISCQKELNGIEVNTGKNIGNTQQEDSYVKYTIPQGDQFCNKNVFTNVKYQQLIFKVKFDSSAIYKTTLASNQYDINKLYGFSDNNADHHNYSARFGWRWSNDSLWLFAYVYNSSVMSFKELGRVDIGVEINCTIKVTKDNYVFGLNGKETLMPRESTTPMAEGYKLYPYFGGDELAPHAISIWINEL